MADVQKENGYVPIARDLLRSIAHAKLSGSEWSVMMAIMDRTYGWNKKSDRISSSQIAEFTGLSAGAVRKILTRLERRGMIDRGDFGPNRARAVGIQKDFERWEVAPHRARQTRALRGASSGNPTRALEGAAVAPHRARDLAPHRAHTETKHSFKQLLPTEVGADAPRDPTALVPREISERLVNLLSKKPGTREAKVEWLDQNIDLMVAELEREGVKDPERDWAGLRRLIFRWYANHLRNPDGPRGPISFEDEKQRRIEAFKQGVLK